MAKITMKEAVDIVGSQPMTMIRNMHVALGLGRNTPEEARRREAAGLILGNQRGYAIELQKRRNAKRPRRHVFP